MATKRPRNTYYIDELLHGLTECKTIEAVWKVLSAQDLDLVKEKNYKSLFREPLSYQGKMGKVGQFYQWGGDVRSEAYICLNGEKQLYLVAKVDYIKWMISKGEITAYGYKNKPIPIFYKIEATKGTKLAKTVKKLFD